MGVLQVDENYLFEGLAQKVWLPLQTQIAPLQHAPDAAATAEQTGSAVGNAEESSQTGGVRIIK